MKIYSKFDVRANALADADKIETSGFSNNLSGLEDVQAALDWIDDADFGVDNLWSRYFPIQNGGFEVFLSATETFAGWGGDYSYYHFTGNSINIPAGDYACKLTDTDDNIKQENRPVVPYMEYAIGCTIRTLTSGQNIKIGIESKKKDLTTVSAMQISNTGWNYNVDTVAEKTFALSSGWNYISGFIRFTKDGNYHAEKASLFFTYPDSAFIYIDNVFMYPCENSGSFYTPSAYVP